MILRSTASGKRLPKIYYQLYFLSTKPQSNTESFAKYGILPYFQSKLNLWLNPGSQVKTPPTEIQTFILQNLLLNKKNVIVNQSNKPGKSLGLLLHALNLSLTKRPWYLVESCRIPQKPARSLDSVILVPTDEMVSKYHKYCEKLISPMEKNCVPVEVFKTNGSLHITRDPLTVKFLSRKKLPEITTDSLDSKLDTANHSQVTVTTLSGLLDTIQNDPDQFKFLRFFAIDQLDYFMKSVDLNGFLVVSQNAKGKYKNRLLETIRQIETLRKDTREERLTEFVKLAARDLNETLTSQQIDEIVRIVSERRVAKFPKKFVCSDLMKEELAERLRYECLDNIQYCIVANPLHPHVLALNELFLQKDLASNSASDIEKKQLYIKNPETFKLKNIINRRFAMEDSLDLFKPLERTNKIELYFPVFHDGQVEDYKNVFNLPSHDQVRKLLEHFVGSKSSIKDYAKKYHSEKKLNSIEEYAEFINVISLGFKKRLPGLSLTVIVPAYINPEELKTKLAVELNDTIDRVLTVPEFLVSGTNLESESFMFAGLDTLMYQTAFTEGNIDKKLNLGVNEPYGDLLHVHIWRLLSSTSVSRKKRVIFALNGNNASSEDLSRIGQIFAFNNISGQLEIKPFVRVS